MPRQPPPPGTKQVLEKEGPAGIVKMLRKRPRASASPTPPGATRTSRCWRRGCARYDIARVAPATAHLGANLFSLEMWGGATFDVAYRFLSEDPWLRLEELRRLVPNVMFQMLVRGANAVGYTNYPDDVVTGFIEEAAAAGMDVFRIFDALNDVDNMQVAIEAAQKSGRIVETSICYTGDVSDPRRKKFDLKYYVDLAKDICQPRHAPAGDQGHGGPAQAARGDDAGQGAEGRGRRAAAPAHARHLGQQHRDVPGRDRGRRRRRRRRGQQHGRDDVAAVAVVAGVRARRLRRAIPASRPDNFEQLSTYWEPVRAFYAPFESGLTAPAADVYEHEIPGGQYSNLRAQAEALGVRWRGGWDAVKRAYADVNRLFGDIPKVTPSSKVVGDMAIWMVKQGLDARAVTERAHELTFPESVIDYMRGSLGQPPGGFPEPLRTKILKGATIIEGRPGASMPPFDWAGAKREMEQLAGVEVARRDVVSYALYPKVMREYMEHRALHGDTSVLPTPTFFYGLRVGEEAWIDIEPGKTLIVKLLSIGDIEPDGARVLTFEINGQSRQMRVADDAAKVSGPKRRRATADKKGEIGAPMPGRVIDLVTKVGEHVKAGQKLLVTEAMKLETVIKAPIDGLVREIVAGAGESVEAGDLLVVIEEGSGGVKLFRFGAPGAEQPGRARCPTARASTRRASAATGTRRSSRRAATAWSGSRAGSPPSAGKAPRVPAGARLASAVARPSKLVCIGLNYRDHARESGAALPGEPIVFLKASSALAGPEDDLRLPVGGEKTDWEVELGAGDRRARQVRRRRGRDVARRRLRAAQRLLRARLPARAARPVDEGQERRRLRAARPVPIHIVHVGDARRAIQLRVRAPVAEGQRRDQAGRHHRRHDLRRPDAGQLRVAVHDAAARRRDQHGHAGRASASDTNRRSTCARATSSNTASTGWAQARQRILAAE